MMELPEQCECEKSKKSKNFLLHEAENMLNFRLKNLVSSTSKTKKEVPENGKDKKNRSRSRAC